MQLHERIKELIKILAKTQVGFASELGVPQGTFNDYLNESGQKKIRVVLLEKILEVFPQVSRAWLYFGEGEPLASPAPQIEVAVPTPHTADAALLERLERLEARMQALEGDGGAIDGDFPCAPTQVVHAARGAVRDGSGK